MSQSEPGPITAENGSAMIRGPLAAEYFCGSSGRGEFPLVGAKYHSFTFRPEEGEGGILVFVSGPSNPCFHPQLWQYWWEGEGEDKKKKVIVDYGITRVARQYSRSEEYGFMVREGEWLYVTALPRPEDPQHNCKLVNLFTMLRYLEGKIGLEELAAAARVYERKRQHAVRLKELSEVIVDREDRLRKFKTMTREFFVASERALSACSWWHPFRSARVINDFKYAMNVVRKAFDIGLASNNAAGEAEKPPTQESKSSGSAA